MNLYDALSQHDVDLIHYYIENYGGSDYEDTSCYVTAPMSTILKPWNDAKERLYSIFGEQMILSKPFSYAKSWEMLSDELAVARCDINNPIGRLEDMLRTNFWLNRRAEEDYGVTDEQAEYLYSMCRPDVLATNAWTGMEFTINGIRVQKGAKIMRILGKILKTFDSADMMEIYEQARLEHSRILNQKRLEGDLCLSIHPLDYMTMSDNDEDWDSCMSWQRSGDYRQGTVEMMNSPYVVVGYLRNPEYEMNVPGGHWNSKKWRCLYIVDRDIIISIREYPYCNDDLDSECLKWLRALCEKNAHWQFQDTMSIFNAARNEYIQYGEKTIPVRFSTYNMYGDFRFERHQCFLNEQVPDQIKIHYSGKSECMCCGKASDNMDRCDLAESDLCCHACSGYETCEICGNECRPGDLYEVDGVQMCECCYDSETATCPICEREGDHRRHRIDNGHNIEMAYLGHLTSNYIDTLCDEHYEKVINGDINIYGPVFYFRDRWNIEHKYVNLEDMTDEDGIEDMLGDAEAKERYMTRITDPKRYWISISNGYSEYDKSLFGPEPFSVSYTAN